jgi:carboxypeptidase Taq
MQERLQQLKARLLEIHDLSAAGSVLGWDQSTYMPSGGGPARARQMATLRRLAHARATDPALGELLDELRPYEESLPYDSDEAGLIRVARRDHERAVKIPTEFVARSARHRAESFNVWAKARPENDFAAVRPYLEKTLELSREQANFFPGYEHIADPLIDFADYGMTVATLRPIFAALREQLTPMVQAIAARPPADDTCLRQHFPPEQQLAFGREVSARLGYDFQRGREDLTHHPFTTSFSVGDVRITTRVNPDLFGPALFATIHESGHAMYQQGISPDYEGTPLARGTSSGVHESQSRLWENVVGRSRGFWEFFYPRLQEAFATQLGSVPLETFYRAVNGVCPGLIRVNADEVTYNLHIIIRFDLELAMLEGRLAISDLPEAWRERYQADLGIVPPDDRDGSMQDMHWYSGYIGGAFQGYTLGNVLSAQFYEAAVAARPEMPAGIEQGDFAPLLGWLVENVYRHGRKFTPAELVERVTGKPLQVEPYIRYLRAKFGELYGL